MRFGFQITVPKSHFLLYYVNLLEQKGETDHEVCFFDGTKMESRAGRYTFVWRETAEKQLAKLKDRVAAELSITTLDELRKHADAIAKGITFVYGSGNRKSPEQREYEKLQDYCARWERCEHQPETMGSDRNSYSKTD